MTSVTIYTKSGCHLCEVAREVVGTVLADFPDDVVSLEEVDILGDPALVAEYGEKIPVVTVDGQMHSIFRVEPARFRSAVVAAAGV